MRTSAPRFPATPRWSLLPDTGITTTRQPSADELSYLAFVLRGGDSAPALVPLGTAAAIEPLITQWQRQINGEAFAAGRATARSEAAYRRVAEELRSRVWDPLVPYLSTATRVFIVPDGALHLVSFAALPTAPSRYLVETGPVIHYLSTERDLIVEGDPGSHANGLLAIGNPAFDESDVSPRVEPVFRGSRSACIDFQSMQFGQLPASANEVNAVVTLWNRTKRNDGSLDWHCGNRGSVQGPSCWAQGPASRDAWILPWWSLCPSIGHSDHRAEDRHGSPARTHCCSQG